MNCMPARRIFRYGLRTFLAIVTVGAIVLGGYMYRIHNQRSAVTWVEVHGGQVTYDFSYHSASSTDSEPLAPPWLRSLLGIDGVAEVSGVSSLNAKTADVSPLARLSSIEVLDLSNTQVSDLSPLSNLESLEVLDLNNTQVSDLTPLAKLKSLTWVGLKNTPVSDKSVEELMKALPNLRVYRKSIAGANDRRPKPLKLNYYPRRSARP